MIPNIFKTTIKIVRYFVQNILLWNNKTNFDILSIEDTLDLIIESGVSVVRYGDGELIYISGKKLPSGYQSQDKKLQEYLVNIVKNNNNSNILVCMPEPIVHRNNLKLMSKIYWTNVVFNEKKNFTKLLGNKVYGNSFISRPYMVYKDKNQATIAFNKLKELWKNKEVLIVEGELSRTGVGNDLFLHSSSLHRIICPSNDAFSFYEEIKSNLKEYIEKNDNGRLLVLLALGPTAKALISDLSFLGVQLIDIGHIDSEYEWYIRGANNKILIEGKHTAERDSEFVDECLDTTYLDSIVAKIGV